MNKRKPDDEFAKIDLSYTNSRDEQVIVHCPESKGAAATQNPKRTTILAQNDDAVPQPVPDAKEERSTTPASPEQSTEASVLRDEPEVLPFGDRMDTVAERHFTIYYGDVGYGYEAIFGPYLHGATEVVVEDPYIRATHQIQNIVSFCEVILKESTVRRVSLVTSYDDEHQMEETEERLGELQQSLVERDIVFEFSFRSTIHDREIRFDNGWVVKIGRGLDFYQKPEGWFTVGANDLSLLVVSPHTTKRTRMESRTRTTAPKREADAWPKRSPRSMRQTNECRRRTSTGRRDGPRERAGDGMSR